MAANLFPPITVMSLHPTPPPPSKVGGHKLKQCVALVLISVTLVLEPPTERSPLPPLSRNT